MTTNQLFKLTFVLVAVLGTSIAHAYYTTKSVTHYQYSAFSSADEASIDLYDGRKKVGIAVFLPLSASQLPKATLSTSDDLIRIYYPIDRLSDVVDMLRNESPVVVRYWHGSAANSHIGLRWSEPVGEGE